MMIMKCLIAYGFVCLDLFSILMSMDGRRDCHLVVIADITVTLNGRVGQGKVMIRWSFSMYGN